MSEPARCPRRSMWESFCLFPYKTQKCFRKRACAKNPSEFLHTGLPFEDPQNALLHRRSDLRENCFHTIKKRGMLLSCVCSEVCKHGHAEPHWLECKAVRVYIKWETHMWSFSLTQTILARLLLARKQVWCFQSAFIYNCTERNNNLTGVLVQLLRSSLFIACS